MAEIKSTLDLVMEKTRNLTLSADEKAAQQHKEAENRIRGLLQKYLDGVVSKPELKADYLRLKKHFGANENTILIDEITARIDAAAAEERTAQLKAELARKHRVSGSAVVPNLEADAQWQLAQSRLHTEFKERMAALY